VNERNTVAPTPVKYPRKELFDVFCIAPRRNQSDVCSRAESNDENPPPILGTLRLLRVSYFTMAI